MGEHAPGGIEPTTLWSLVERRARLTPDAVMAVDELDRSLTFGEYLHAAERTAAGLHAMGLGDRDVVTWQLPTSLEAIVLMAALGRLGVTQSPILPILGEREVGFVTGQLRTRLLVVPGVWRGTDHPATAASVARRTGCEVLVSDPGSGDGIALPAGDPADLPAAPVLAGGADPVRWVFYTSGTTADPKGVQHTDPTAVATAIHLLAGLALDRPDTVLSIAPITHVGGIMTLAAQLMTGFRTILMRAFDPIATPALAARHRLTVLRAPVPVTRAFLAAQEQHGAEPLFPDLRACQCGGSSRPIELSLQVRRVLGLPGAASSYGMTECPGVTAISPSDTADHLTHTAGRVTPGSELRVVGPDGRDLPAGTEGELLVRGRQLFVGYVDPALNEGAFDEQGFFHSGDLGVVDEDGYVRITGRIKDIIIRNGENISALQVEDVLDAHPAIADVAVVGLPDERTGERCCAVVSLEPGTSSLTLSELADFCRRAGLATQKIPEQLELHDVPRNSMGKIEKQKLRDLFAPSALA